MKTESFDDAIRRKLESIRYTPEEKDIEEVYNHARKNTSSPFTIAQYGWWAFVFYTLSLGALLTWNYRQMQKQDELIAAMNKLQQSFVLAEQKQTAKTDTITVIKYITTSSAADNSSFSAYAHTDHFIGSEKLQPLGATTGKKNRMIRHEKNFSQNTAAHLYDESGKHKGLVREENPVSRHRLLLSNSSIGQNPITQEPPFVRSADQKNEPTSEAVQNTGIPKDTVGVLVINTDSTLGIKREQKKKTNLLSFVSGCRAGAGLEKINTGFGLEFLGEIFLSKRFSIQAGISWVQSGKSYMDADDYFMNTSTDFYKKYQLPKPVSASVSDIRIRYNRWQVPVSVVYYQPFRNNFALMGSLGTALDMYVQESIHYGYGNLQSEEKFKMKTKVSTINNYTVSLGIQKTWDRWSLQFQPFISPQLKTVEYKQEKVYGGARLRVLYTIR